jgi:CelD/BcsL family acetyltransferase involved in cellulose biosynthesis
MRLDVQAIDSLEGMKTIESEWREVWRRDAAATPFEGPDWLLPWTRWLWGGGKLRVLAIRNGREMVAVAPFFLWGYGGKPAIIRVSFLGAGITDHLGMAAAPGFELQAASAVYEHLAGMADEWQACDLQELRPGSPLLCAEAPAGLTLQEAPCGVCPVLSLPKSPEELLAALDAKFRRNLKVADSRLEREGAAFERVAPGDCREAMEALIRLHEARWRERHEPGMLASGALQNFHLDAGPRLAAQGLVRLYTLRIGGEIIAVQYNLWRDGRVYAYLSGFEPAHQRSSPGAALLAFSIRCAIEEGATEFDFLRNREGFKYQWGARDRVNRKLIVQHSTARVRDVA